MSKRLLYGLPALLMAWLLPIVAIVAGAGRYRALMVRVLDRDIQVSGLKVTFASGATEDLPFSGLLRAGSNSGVLGLADGTDNPRVAFGYHLTRSTGAAELAWSDLFDVVRDTPGVRKLGDARADFLLNGLPADVALHQREFPVLGHVEIVDGDTGATL